MPPTDFDVTHLAHLARIELTDAERVQFARELPRILAYVDQLKAVDTTKVAETSQVTDLSDVVRPDEPTRLTLEERRTRRAALLAAAPVRFKEFVEVPAILGDQS